MIYDVLVRFNGWAKSPATNTRGPYAYHQNTGNWVGYDDESAIENKARFVINEGYGGAALWTIDYDDFNNLCCRGPNPLLNTLSEALRGVKSSKQISGCQRPRPPATPPPKKVETTTIFDSLAPEQSGE